MSRELEFDGYWEGQACFTCDGPGCRNRAKFRFDSEEEAKDYKGQREQLKGMGWIFTKVNGRFLDFCCESHRNDYIRKNTF